MKGIQLHPHELLALREWRLTGLWRPCKEPKWPATVDGKRCGLMLVDMSRAVADRGFLTDENGELLPSDQWATAPESAFRYGYLHVPFAHPEDGWDANGEDARERYYCDFRPGETRWVRESWAVMLPAPITDWPEKLRRECTIYRDGHRDPDSVCWRPSTTMPAWAARSFLRVVSVEARRVSSITEEEAKAWGCEPDVDYIGVDRHDGSPVEQYVYRESSLRTWEHIYPRHPFSSAWAWRVGVEQAEREE
jgi:hypothetical protein